MNTKQIITEVKEELKAIISEMEAMKPQADVPATVTVPEDCTSTV